MRQWLRVPAAVLAAIVLVALGAALTYQLAGGAVSVALAVPVVVWLGLETTALEGAVGAALVGVVLDAAAGGPAGLLTSLSVVGLLGARAGAGPFDARTDLGFGLLSGAVCLGMGLLALLLVRYVSPLATTPPWSLAGRIVVEAALTGLAAPLVRRVLDRIAVPAHREHAGLSR